jgi:hypothetical protein
MVFFYVDDFLFIAPRHQQKEIQSLKTLLNEKYGIKDLGPATSFLNIRITRDTNSRTTMIDQRPYIDKLIQKYHLQGMLKYPIHTPLSPSFKPVPHEGSASLNEKKEYQCKTGSVLYTAIVSRPDIAFAASVLCQFNENPSKQHRDEVNRVLGYLAQTRDYAIKYTYNPDHSRIYEIASDASYADDITTRRSTQAYIMKLFNGPIAWQSTKQKTVTTSTTEAELLALSNTARETIAIMRLFSQMRLSLQESTSIECDNQQTVGLITKPRPELTTKLRHVDIHHYWLRQTQQQGLIAVEWTPTADMIADGLTKPLPRHKHEKFMTQLGLIRQPHSTEEEVKNGTDNA